MPLPKVYLASGWFNPAQMEQMNEVYGVLKGMEDVGALELFAPYYDGIVLKRDDPNLSKKMATVWWLDITKLVQSDLVIVCTQDHDVGTIYEAGYAGAHNITVICYNSNPELGLNVMLAQAARGFTKTEDELVDAVYKFITAKYKGKMEDWSYNRWEGDPI